MKQIRAFIALELPDDVKTHLAGVSQVLAGQMPSQAVRWVTPARMHLTLRFLGDTPIGQLPLIARALDAAVSRQTPFTLYLNQLGCFPNRQRPRLIWAGLAGGEKALPSFKQAVDSALAPLGWEPEDRPFQPHLTLGRVKDERKMRGIKWAASLEPLAVPVTAVHLIQSQLTPEGPIYTVRHTSPLSSK